MEDERTLEREARIDRRTFLAGLGAGTSALAGCSGGAPETVVKTRIEEETVVRTRTVDRRPTPTRTPAASGGATTTPMFNPMGYTGADDLIEEQATMMDPEARKPVVKAVLARIWSDAPTMVTFYSNRLQVANERFSGWIGTVGGIVNVDSFLNLRRADGRAGGSPVQGMNGAPDTLNVLATSSVYAFEVLDSVYGYGTTLDPETLELAPWSFRDWDLRPENVGTASPTIVADLRDDLTFNDGTPLTAADVKFTVEYVTEQEPAGSVSASQFAAVEAVEVDRPGGTTVSYYLSERDNAWFTTILGNVILPKHVWSGVADYKQYTPRDSSEGLVGSGPMVLSDFSWGNWFELEMRPADELWQNGAAYATWLDPDGPFLDGRRIEVFGSTTALERALLDGDLDVAYTSDGVSVDAAVRATGTDGLAVVESPDDGWEHFSFNLRRVPLDDPAFRQTLVALLDDDWIVDDLLSGVGGVEGSYVTPVAYSGWRPPEPADTGGSYEGIPTPPLEFPGEPGTFQLGADGIEAARDFLSDHDRAVHDYTWEEASVEGAAAPDGRVLHVDGEPLTAAHTDNGGRPGRGPLEVGINPPQIDLDKARIAQQWVGAAKRVGIPMETRIQSFNSQFVRVFGREDFDIFGMSWNGITVNNDHYRQLFGSAGADLGY